MGSDPNRYASGTRRRSHSSINDESTSVLVSEFYRQLKDGDNSKAKALQTAQVTLLRQDQYRHPSYWAPFLLIGNWL